MLRGEIISEIKITIVVLRRKGNIMYIHVKMIYRHLKDESLLLWMNTIPRG